MVRSRYIQRSTELVRRKPRIGSAPEIRSGGCGEGRLGARISASTTDELFGVHSYMNEVEGNCVDGVYR